LVDIITILNFKGQRSNVNSAPEAHQPMAEMPNKKISNFGLWFLSLNWHLDFDICHLW
jgi:hypothetical protein